MMKRFIIWFLCIVLISNATLWAQKSTNNVKPTKSQSPIKLKIKTNGLTTYCFLAYHQGPNKYKIDSIPFNSKGEGQYVDVENKIRGGIYLLVFPTLGNNYFEFLMSLNERYLEFVVDTAAIHKSKVINSPENDLFYGEIEFVSPMFREIQDLNNKRKLPETSEKEKIEIDRRLKEIEDKIQQKRDEAIKNHPNMLYSKVMKMMKDIDVPEPPRDSSGKILDSNFQYQYYKAHYWDNIDLNDDRLLYTPVFDGKYKTFFERVIPKHPDSIKYEIDRVLAKIKDPNSMINRFVLGNLLNEFANSKIMGQDALYVHLVNNYYRKNRAPWVDSVTLQKMGHDADDIEPILIGKTAPDFSVFDTSLTKVTKMYDLKSKYKLIVFYNHDCGHCKKEIPRIDSLYPDLLKRGIDVFSVCTVVDKDDEVSKWKAFLKEKKLRFPSYADPRHQLYPFFKVLYKIKGTPEYFLLDSSHKIIAKKLAPDQLIDFIENYEKIMAK